MPLPDPLLGKTIAERYEVVSLLKRGGTGAVYRATQRSLDRVVALKLVKPDLVAPEATDRFMAEARVASRMNHPHLAGIFDFGRTLGKEGDILFLATELVTGSDLAEVVGRVGLLPLARVTNIVSQVLEALSEAHQFGIIHYDVKPENILLTLARSDDDQVKVIDFGVARMLSSSNPPSATEATPEYSAPEHAMGDSPSPAADIYSVGVLLFELLTGRLPFLCATPAATMHAHLAAPRPDPRQVVSGRRIPDALAEACIRAMAVRPGDWFESARAFAQALRVSQRSGSAPPPAHSSAQPPAPTPLLGRNADLAWAREAWSSPLPAPWIAFSGSPGVGRTCMLRAFADLARQEGALVLDAALEPRPYHEIGYRGLLRMVACLVGRTISALMNGAAETPADGEAMDALRSLVPRVAGAHADPATTRKAALDVLAWAARKATARANGAPTVLLIDDIDRLDIASLNALRDQQRADPIRGFTVISTSEQAPVAGSFDGIATRALTGLTRADSLRLLKTGDGVDRALTRGDDDIEPMYLEELRDGNLSDVHTIPATLRSIVQWRVQGLSADQRRALQAVAIAGVASLETLTHLLRASRDGGSDVRSDEPLPPPSDVEGALRALLDGGFLSLAEGQLTVTHDLVARTAIASIPGGTLAAIHAAAADRGGMQDWLELRAHHAIRGRADFAAFLLVEEAARMRARRGDTAGAIAMLGEAVKAARTKIMRGDGDAAVAALGVFGRKLATALVGDGRFDEGERVLEEILSVSESADLGRALVLEQLAAASDLRGRVEKATRYGREALAIAERSGDAVLADRIRVSLAERSPRPPITESAPSSQRRRRPVLVVEDDRAIREGLKSVVESDGREAFGAANGREALDVLRRIPRPGLILLDLMMPIMTGWELLERLRSDDTFAAIPVVVVSAVSKREEPGAVRVVQKPVDVKTLLALVEEFCD